MRHEKPYLIGKVWAVDQNGVRAGSQTFDVYEEHRVVLLDSASMDASEGNNGEDNRGQGGGRAMLDELDCLYPKPEWWMASSEGALHTQEGVHFMRRRQRAGRRKVHTETCALQRPEGCECDFPVRPIDPAAGEDTVGRTGPV